jgi:RNA polymerase sigma factor (sigma-70 family)
MEAAIIEAAVDRAGAGDHLSAELIERVIGGDREAFGRLVEPYLAIALGAARLITGDEADAADAVQDALLKAWLGLPGLRDPQLFPAWFRRIVIRSAARSIRGRPIRWVELDPDAQAPADSLDRELDRRLLARAFGRLDAKDRVLLTLHHYWQLPVAETSRILDLPEGTVRSRVHHALRRLRAGYDAEARR